ncbi:AlbA family DNA-binding domain-containing protein [Allosalinactinospora lopnorensis]|uniref:AlbA family DNA-binding domain-containing protein n=1 Tax=Allosalinactinospora lopnorensis TaxID=1352348 RepID=UPI000623E247|nr:ATP-binding protein [Allosalinactinospora lopnorensis]
MATLRSARLERLLGAAIAEATYEHVCSLVDNSVVESFDLDYKAQLYGTGDSEKRELAGDIAAMANTVGGLIILGINEDDQARASAAPGVPVSDAEVTRIYQTAASRLSPLPGLDVRVVPDPASGGDHGVILIAVPPSPARPHAVLVNNALRYPRRHGTTTVYLSEPEVAEAYRERFTSVAERADRLERYESELLTQLDTTELTYVAVSLLPDMPGAMTIDTAAGRAFQEQALTTAPMIAETGWSWTKTMVGPGRFIALADVSDQGKTKWRACELHIDGGGAFATFVDVRRSHDGAAVENSRVDDENLALGILSGLRLLGQHARDRTATSGNATVRATLHPVRSALPAKLTHSRFHSISQGLGPRTLIEAPDAATVADIDALADEGPELVAAAHRLGGHLVQAFGRPEILQFSPQGQLRMRYWDPRFQPSLRAWAEQAGVECVNDTVR